MHHLLLLIAQPVVEASLYHHQNTQSIRQHHGVLWPFQVLLQAVPLSGCSTCRVIVRY